MVPARKDPDDGSTRLAAFGQRRLVGRLQELETLARLLEAGERLITLVGPPGVGKTRLAIEAARASSRDLALPSRWAALGAHTAVEDVVAAVADLLGVSPATGELAARVGDVLAGNGPLLLALDDADGVGAGLGLLMERWLARAPELRVLVTSRTRLGLDEERVVEVAPLPIDDAIALFELRARAARRPLRAQAAPPDVTRSLVARLDCLPLAIELAAARTAVLPPQKLLARLEQHLDEVLRGPEEHGRHASLAAAIEASWRLLGEAEREVLAESAAFAASFTLEAAEAVRRDGGMVLDTLASLHERSLIERVEVPALASEVRFRLYRSVRAFALQKLDERGGRPEAERRVDAFVVAECERLVEALRGPSALEMEQRLELERDQLVATHRRAVDRAPGLGARAGLALAELSALRGFSSTRLHEATLRAARASGDAKLVARAQVSLAEAAARLGAADEPRRALDEAIAVAASLGDDALLGGALFARGRFLAQHGDFDAADADLARAEALLDALDAPHAAASVRNVQGCVAEARGAFEAAVRAFEAARAGFRRHGSARMEAAVLNNLGVVRQAEGRREDSLRLYEAALACAIASQNRIIEADTRMNLGSFYLGEGDLDRAEEHSRIALGLQRRLGNRRFEGVTLLNLAMTAHERGALRAARDSYQEGIGMLRECGEVRFLAMGLPFAAAAEAQLGLLLEARADFEAARRAPAGMDPAWSTVVGTLETFLELAETRGAEPARRGLAERHAAERLARARAGLATGGPAQRSPELALAARLLAKALDAPPAPAADAGAPPESSPRARLVVGGEQSWFCLDVGPRVDLSRRGPLRLILRVLVEQRQDAPGIGVAPERLFAAGWSGQKALPHAAANRVYSAIATLRRLGLDGVLHRHDDGYLLDPTLAIEKRSA